MCNVVFVNHAYPQGRQSGLKSVGAQRGGAGISGYSCPEMEKITGWQYLLIINERNLQLSGWIWALKTYFLAPNRGKFGAGQKKCGCTCTH